MTYRAKSVRVERKSNLYLYVIEMDLQSDKIIFYFILKNMKVCHIGRNLHFKLKVRYLFSSWKWDLTISETMLTFMSETFSLVHQKFNNNKLHTIYFAHSKSFCS